MDTTKRGLAWPLVREPAVASLVRPTFSQRLLTCVLGLFLGVAVSWQVLREPGVVGFVHDWSIAPFAEQHLALLRQTFDGWYRWGLGEPVAYPFEYPLRLLLGVAAAAGMGGDLLSKAIVLFVPACAFVAATYLARACRLPYGAAWLCGAFYALDPVMLNKLVSGQADYLIGYALLPLIPALFIVACERGQPLVGGIAVGGVLALVAMEVQLGVLGALLLLLLAAFSRRVGMLRRLAILGAAFAVVAVIEAPTFVWAAHGISGLARLDQFGHGAAWLEANSLAPQDALRLIGYLAQYDILSVGSWITAWQPASWVVVVAALTGLLALPGPMRPTLFLAGTAAVLFACGTTTPLGPLLTWVFERFEGAQVFRELYHVMAAVSLAYAIGVASAFALAERVAGARIIRGVLLAAVAIYVAPMLSGDVSGWLAGVPVDRYLAPAFHNENAGTGRVVWFPMDQPLAFDDRGSGVDPLAVTERGSLWLYSLEWPLTAVDADARTGKLGALQRDLRALGVSAAVERDRLHSRYRTLPRVADLADRFFGSDVKLGAALGSVHEDGPGLRTFTISDPLPVVRAVSRYAVVPRRLSVIADASLGGAATFGFGQRRPPAGIPYDAYFDAGDGPWEALQVHRLTGFVPQPRVDAFTGFAGGDLWWWYRPQYADARRFSLAIGRATTLVSANDALVDGTLVVAWIATPAGGRLAVRCGSARRIFDTGGTWGAWRSEAVACGPMPAGARATLSAADDDAEVAMRGARLVEASAYGAALEDLRALLHGAGRTVPLERASAGGLTLVRTGRSAALGALPEGARAMLEIERSADREPATVRVETRGGYTVAWRSFAPGEWRIRIPLVAGIEPMRVTTRATIQGWRLWELRGSRQIPATAASAGPARLVVADQTFDGGWQAAGAVGHLSSALGTNVFVLPAPVARVPTVWYAYSDSYHVAYFFGGLMLSLALAIGFTFALNLPK